jgi:hypothetical protein
VLDAVSRFVNVIERQAEILHEIGLPKPVGPNQELGVVPTADGEFELVARGDDPTVANQAPQSPSSQHAAAHGAHRLRRAASRRPEFDAQSIASRSSKSRAASFAGFYGALRFHIGEKSTASPRVRG